MTPTRVGDIETKTYIWRWRECEACGKPAAYLITFLLDGARHNPASKGYGKNDVSWCSDYEIYACKVHKAESERNAPWGYGRCSAFLLAKFKHLGFYRVEVKP